MRRIEATLQRMDKMDDVDGPENYLMSHSLDDNREDFPSAWPESRTKLMDRLEKKALEYGIKLLPL